MSHGSRPGERRGGRQKGTPNKTTKEVKEALEDAFEQLGGPTALADWGKKNPGGFYTLWAKLLPIEARISGESSGLLDKAKSIREARDRALGRSL